MTSLKDVLVLNHEKFFCCFLFLSFFGGLCFRSVSPKFAFGHEGDAFECQKRNPS
jgi:hypothetical protein